VQIESFLVIRTSPGQDGKGNHQAWVAIGGMRPLTPKLHGISPDGCARILVPIVGPQRPRAFQARTT